MSTLIFKPEGIVMTPISEDGVCLSFNTLTLSNYDDLDDTAKAIASMYLESNKPYQQYINGKLAFGDLARQYIYRSNCEYALAVTGKSTWYKGEDIAHVLLNSRYTSNVRVGGNVNTLVNLLIELRTFKLHYGIDARLELNKNDLMLAWIHGLSESFKGNRIAQAKCTAAFTNYVTNVNPNTSIDKLNWNSVLFPYKKTEVESMLKTWVYALLESACAAAGKNSDLLSYVKTRMSLNKESLTTPYGYTNQIITLKIKAPK